MKRVQHRKPEAVKECNMKIVQHECNTKNETQ